MDQGIRSLVVHLDGPHRAVERLQAARRLATEHGASVSVIYASAPAVMVIPAGDGGGYAAQAMLELDEQRRSGARAAFRQVFGTPAAGRAEMLEPPLDDALHGFAAQAMYGDLVVLGQSDPSETGLGGVPGDFPELVLARSGRACLLVPWAGSQDRAFTTVAIAWKETPEAVRALAASLPILRKAARVHVIAWGAGRSRPDRPRLDLPGYLERHGIAAQWHDGGAEPTEIGELLLSRAADLEADLLVMGCYGHSRAREWIRGGASRTVLRSMTLPVLMAH